MSDLILDSSKSNIFSTLSLPLKSSDITKILPHRYPFLLVDKITELTEDYILGVKNVTHNEHFFSGHFPDYPIMPGVLILEVAAQVAGIFIYYKELHPSNPKDMSLRFAGMEKVKFRKEVLPGDVLMIKIDNLNIKKLNGSIFATFNATISTDNQIAAQASMTCVATLKKSA